MYYGSDKARSMGIDQVRFAGAGARGHKKGDVLKASVKGIIKDVATVCGGTTTKA